METDVERYDDITLREMEAYARNIVERVDEDSANLRPEKRYFLFTLVAEKVIRALGDEYFYADGFLP